ncbi:hypothetical protein N431DRAFT_126192 [Stipitochalara longipes BDJ]|nr:hypothetical protein N431DRAFT_126192 [Stipitochalara longipes BDJ]
MAQCLHCSIVRAGQIRINQAGCSSFLDASSKLGAWGLEWGCHHGAPALHQRISLKGCREGLGQGLPAVICLGLLDCRGFRNRRLQGTERQTTFGRGLRGPAGMGQPAYISWLAISFLFLVLVLVIVLEVSTSSLPCCSFKLLGN